MASEEGYLEAPQRLHEDESARDRNAALLRHLRAILAPTLDDLGNRLTRSDVIRKAARHTWILGYQPIRQGGESAEAVAQLPVSRADRLGAPPRATGLLSIDIAGWRRNLAT
jgi:hypothetical protein